MLRKLFVIVALIAATLLFTHHASAKQNAVLSLQPTTVVSAGLTDAEIQCKLKERIRIVVIRDSETGKVIAVYIIHEDYWEPCK